MEFSSSPPEDNFRNRRLDFDIFPQDQDSSATQVVHRIKGAKRQEERAALLLAEFLKDRSSGTQIINSYTYDKAMLTNSVLKVLSKVLLDEASGKKRSNLQIARKVSGCFAQAEDKRHVLVYFFAKHLHQYPEIRAWLKQKSIHKLSQEKRQEIGYLLNEPRG
jgi:hypothetical protein